MYYDLEFPIGEGLNEGKAEGWGDAMVDMVVALTREEISDRFGLAVDCAGVVELDSSSAKKFSRHLTIPLPGGRMLASNAHAGAIAAAVVRRIHRKVQEGEGAFAELLVQPSREDSGEREPFIDLSVCVLPFCPLPTSTPQASSFLSKTLQDEEIIERRGQMIEKEIRSRVRVRLVSWQLTPA